MLIKSLCIKNLLSFGPDTELLPLAQLNMLIGPNGSGKSNFLEAISLLQAAPKDLSAPVKEVGGVRDWLWKGKPNAVASLEAMIENPRLDKPVVFFRMRPQIDATIQRVGSGRAPSNQSTADFGIVLRRNDYIQDYR